MTSMSAKFRFLIVTAMQSPRIVRHSSTSAKGFLRNISFLTTSKNILEPEKKPIVLLYCWLLAKNKHIRHYTDLYKERGFDILQVRVSPQEVLWPQFVKKTVTEIGNFLFSEPGRPLVVHGFSVGGYVHIEVLRHLLNSDMQSKSQEVLKRLKGQIFDSVVDVVGVAEGISEAMFPNSPILQKIARISIDNYLKITEKSVTAIHRSASGIFHSNSLKIPSLMLYSKLDKVGNRVPIESAIDGWKAKDIFVMSKCWSDSPHVGHFRMYRNEYISTLDSFLGEIGFGHVPVEDKDVLTENVETDIPVSQVDEKAIDSPIIKSEEFISTKRKIFASHKSGI